MIKIRDIKNDYIRIFTQMTVWVLYMEVETKYFRFMTVILIYERIHESEQYSKIRDIKMFTYNTIYHKDIQ